MSRETTEVEWRWVTNVVLESQQEHVTRWVRNKFEPTQIRAGRVLRVWAGDSYPVADDPGTPDRAAVPDMVCGLWVPLIDWVRWFLRANPSEPEDTALRAARRDLREFDTREA